MSQRYIPFTTDPRFAQRVRELETITVMVDMYCAAHHGGGARCAACDKLLAYAQRRLTRCVFGDAKPNCAQCVVHCYTKDMREQVRTVMRWAGPRMLLRHPILAVRHLLAERKPVPVLPGRPVGDAAPDVAGPARRRIPIARAADALPPACVSGADPVAPRGQFVGSTVTACGQQAASQ